MKIYDFDPTNNSEDHANKIFEGILQTDQPDLISYGLQLMESQEFKEKEALFIQNTSGKTIHLNLFQSNDFFYVAFNSDFEYESDGILFGNKELKDNKMTLSFRYLLIYRNVIELIQDLDQRWKSNELVKFLAQSFKDSPSDAERNKLQWKYDQAMLSKIVKGLDDAETSKWWMNRY